MANTFKFGNGNWAVKDGYALAYNDENNNFKPLPFDFTRASSATRVNKQGLIETVPSGKPRIDFLNNTSGHLLIEPSRTNSINYSEAISNAPVKSGTFTDNFAISPDGTQNATKLTAGNTDPYFYQNVAFTAGDYTASLWVKGIGGAIGKEFRFAISGETHSSNKYEIPSEWTRFEFTATITTGTFSTGLEIPDPAVSGDEVLVWGWQVEAGSYATSYIKTEGSSVTRVAETSEINSVPNVPTSYPFVMYVEGNHTLGQESGTCGFYDKSNQYYYYSILFASNNKIQALSRPQGTENILTSTSTYTDGFHKVAVLFLNDTTVKLYVDGELEATKTDCSNNSFNTSFTDYVIGVFRSISTNSCNIKDFRIFNHELSNTELQNLTS